MKKLLKEAIKKTPLYAPLRDWVIIGAWKHRGRPVPPPHVFKQRVLRSYADKFRLKVLVETGTYSGDMVDAMKGHFDRIYSVELNKDFFEKAQRRFQAEKTVELIQGDSGIELGSLMERINQPALFWLDGHYSGGMTAKGDKDTPIYEELAAILDAREKGHVIIIDDAWCFGVDPAYPTVEDLRNFVRSKRPDTSIAVEDDSIRITPNRTSSGRKPAHE